ncbi:MAG: SDR family oxidoreductase [Anaerolineae bacterium]|nr:SDR family oxidoreductase [Anaerolineae bacterium]
MTHQARQSAVVVTGASSGIGRACAIYLDQWGFQVFAGIRQQQDADVLRHRASARLTPVVLDVTKNETIMAAAETVWAATARLNLVGLVNNAGIAVAGPLEFVSVAELRRQFEANVLGQVAVTQAFLPLLRCGQGRIVNIGSMGGRIATPFLGPYAASKFALEALTDSLRLELRPWQIHVSIIEPVGIATPIWDKSLAQTEQMANQWPEQAYALYQEAMEKTRQFALNTKQTAIPPEIVARAVAHALTAKRPKTRYLVGKHAKLMALAARLPDRWRDWLVTKVTL